MGRWHLWDRCRRTRPFRQGGVGAPAARGGPAGGGPAESARVVACAADSLYRRSVGPDRAARGAARAAAGLRRGAPGWRVSLAVTGRSSRWNEAAPHALKEQAGPVVEGGIAMKAALL